MGMNSFISIYSRKVTTLFFANQPKMFSKNGILCVNSCFACVCMQGWWEVLVHFP